MSANAKEEPSQVPVEAIVSPFLSPILPEGTHSRSPAQQREVAWEAIYSWCHDQGMSNSPPADKPLNGPERIAWWVHCLKRDKQRLIDRHVQLLRVATAYVDARANHPQVAGEMWRELVEVTELMNRG